jgi:cytochrome c-type biogenesis protein
MSLAGPSLPLVFLAGVVSFISPCVLPLVPAYLSTISGVSYEEIEVRSASTSRRVALASGLFFVGFISVFVALGASASVIGTLLDSHRLWFNRVAGATIVVFGLSMLGVGWSGALGATWTRGVQQVARTRGGPVALGVAFAFCWTPCIGPILASILTLASASGSLADGVALLLVYGLGLAAPFLIVGFSFTRALAAFRRVQRHYRAIQAVSGLLLVAMGVLLLSDRLFLLNSYAQRGMSAVGLDWWTSL